MAKYYPVYIDLHGKKALVAGGGDIAERKVESLLRADAKVTVVSPELNKGLAILQKKEDITYIKNEFKKEFLDGAVIVIGATDNPDINSLISREAKKRNILVNIVDLPDQCSFIVPSVVERGDLTISISTSGSSPALAKKIRKDLEKTYGDEHAVLLEIMREMREHVKQKFPTYKARNRVFSRIVDTDEIAEIIKNEGKDKARERVEKIVEEM